MEEISTTEINIFQKALSYQSSKDGWKNITSALLSLVYNPSTTFMFAGEQGGPYGQSLLDTLVKHFILLRDACYMISVAGYTASLRPNRLIPFPCYPKLAGTIVLKH